MLPAIKILILFAIEAVIMHGIKAALQLFIICQECDYEP
jgi:hypothetical protein